MSSRAYRNNINMKKKKKTTSISFDIEVHERINNAAKFEGRTISNFLNHLLRSLFIENTNRLNE